MKTIKGDLILKENTTFDESIKVEGDIKGYFNLKVMGNINAMNIDARDIDAMNINAMIINARDINAWDINARDIDAMNINAMNIDARDIDAMNIICEKRIKKNKYNKTICRIYITNKSKLIKKEHKE